MPLDEKGGIEAALQSGNDLVQVGVSSLERDQSGEFIPAQPGQHIAAEQLVINARGHFLEVNVAHMMAEGVVDRLELVEVEIDHSEDAARASLLNQNIKPLVQREAVVNIGE